MSFWIPVGSILVTGLERLTSNVRGCCSKIIVLSYYATAYHDAQSCKNFTHFCLNFTNNLFDRLGSSSIWQLLIHRDLCRIHSFIRCYSTSQGQGWWLQFKHGWTSELDNSNATDLNFPWADLELDLKLLIGQGRNQVDFLAIKENAAAAEMLLNQSHDKGLIDQSGHIFTTSWSS